MSEGISETKIKWFREQNFEITLYPEKTVKRFRDPLDLEKFLEIEMDYWKNFNQVKAAITNYKARYNNAIKAADNPANLWQKYFNDLLAVMLSHGKMLLSAQSYWCCSSTKIGKRLRSLLDQHDFKEEEKVRLVRNFLRAFFGLDFNLNNQSDFFGALDGYFFSAEAKSHRSRFNRQKKEFHELHSEIDTFYDECVEKEIERRKIFEKLNIENEEIRNTAASSFEEKQEDFSKRIQSLIESFKSLNHDHLQNFKAENKKWHDTKEEKVQKLENSYGEKLRLSTPIRYWENICIDNTKIGWRFFWCTIGVTIFSIICLMVILYKWPPTWFDADGWDLNTIKGSLVLITLTSIAAYIIHLTAKFCISSFHLARDANERKQLTHVYLSLIQENAISKEEQKIVLQSLFSRADTGLLKGEHAPTMPFVDRLISKD